MPALEADEAAEAEAAKARGETRARLDARAALLANRRQDLEVRNAGLHERQQFLERRSEETERRLEADAVGARRRPASVDSRSSGRSARWRTWLRWSIVIGT